jgi:Domain of unknown function (DUF932)
MTVAATTTVFPANRRNPWHTLGTDVAGMTWAEALPAAGLDYVVEKHPLDATVIGEDGVGIVTMPEHVATIARYDDGTLRPLGVVGKNWHPVQIATMVDVVQDIVGTSSGTVGAIGEFRSGKSVFMQVDLPRSLKIGGVDEVDLTILASNAFDGTCPRSSSGTRPAPTPASLRPSRPSVSPTPTPTSSSASPTGSPTRICGSRSTRSSSTR